MQKITIELKFKDLQAGPPPSWNISKTGWTSEEKRISTDELITTVAETLGDALRRCREGDTLTVTIVAD